MIKRGTTKNSKIFKGTTKVKYVYKGTTKVWSGASLVSYYDGDTLIGTEEVEEGQDILHPSIDTSKAGYTLFGWADSKDSNDRIGYRVATGEPMAVYAIYLADSITVATGTVLTGGWTDYVQGVKNENYVTGSTACVLGFITYGQQGHSGDKTTSFTLNLGNYTKAVVTFRFEVGNGNNVYAMFDGVSVSSGSITVNTSGTHTMYVKGNAIDNSWCSATLGITSIILSEPQEWV